MARAMSDAPNPAPDPAPAVSIVVPHYNDLERLDRCLDRLVAQILPEGGRFEIVVADNGSPQGEAAVAACIAGRARLVPAPEKGAGPARNAGVAATRAPLLAFTDADCLPQPGWLAAGLAKLAAFDLVGGRMVVVPEHDGTRTGAEAFELVFAFDNERYVREDGYTVTANLFCSRAVFDTVGPFRTGVSEDMEWSRRATAKGFTLGYAADAVVGHPPRPDWPALIGKWRRIEAERFLLELQSRPRGRLRWLARSWMMPVSILAHLPRIWRSPELHSAAERRAAAWTLARLRLWRMADAHRRVLARRRG